MEALTSIGVAIEVARGLFSLKKGFDEASFKISVSELMVALSEAKMERC